MRRATPELIADATGLTSEMHSVKDQMCDWRGKIENALVQKRVKLNCAYFKKFSQNWLLIYDFPPLGDDKISYQLAVLYLNALFSRPHKGFDFNTVFILSNHYLFRWRDRILDFNYYTG